MLSPCDKHLGKITMIIHLKKINLNHTKNTDTKNRLQITLLPNGGRLGVGLELVWLCD